MGARPAEQYTAIRELPANLRAGVPAAFAPPLPPLHRGQARARGREGFEGLRRWRKVDQRSMANWAVVNGQQVLPAGGGARGGLRPRPRAPNASRVAGPRPTSRPRPAHSEEGARRGRRPGEWRTSSTNSLPGEHRSKRRVPAMPRQEGEEGPPLRAWRRASPATPRPQGSVRAHAATARARSPFVARTSCRGKRQREKI